MLIKRELPKDIQIGVISKKITQAPKREVCCHKDIAENYKLVLHEFPEVSFEQKLQIMEVFIHSHVDAKHIALFKLQPGP